MHTGCSLKLCGLSGLWKIKDPPPGTTQGHTNWVTNVAFTPDGRQLATGSLDNTTRVWDLSTGKQSAVLEVRVHSHAMSRAHILGGDTHMVEGGVFSP